MALRHCGTTAKARGLGILSARYRFFFVALISFVGGSLFLSSATSGHRRLHAIYCISLIHSGCNVLFYMFPPLGIQGAEGHLSISEERDWHEYSTLNHCSQWELKFSLGYRAEVGETEE